jgi:membrane protease YdiL (CAAX protease family)
MATVTPPARVPAHGATPRPGWIRRHPLAAFLLVCFGLTWAALIPAVAASRGWLPLSIPTWLVLPLAGWGPGLAAFSVAVATGRGGELLARITRWRLGLGWYAVALLGPGVLYAAAVALNALLGGTLSRLPALSPTLLVGLVLVLGFDLLTHEEEIGWRGFLLPCLLERYSPLEASLVVGIVSAAWHLPYFLWLAHPLASTPLAAFAFFTLAGSVILTWLYRGAGGSAVPAILMHAVNATWPALLPSAPTETRPFELYAGLYTLIAGLLVLSRRVPTGAVEPDVQCASQ